MPFVKPGVLAPILAQGVLWEGDFWHQEAVRMLSNLPNW